MVILDKVRYRLGRLRALGRAFGSTNNVDAWSATAAVHRSSEVSRHGGDDSIARSDGRGDRGNEKLERES